MIDLLSKLSEDRDDKLIDPREIFMSLPNRSKQYEYPRDVQTEVWKKWFGQRNVKNSIIKMNTGSGKTVVGLTILQSCLNEGVYPAVYVVPDLYLVKQVIAEANNLGIKVTDDRDNYFYNNGQAILVMPIHALVNGKSVFGMRISGNYPIGSILMDDVHACMETISSQYSLKIKRNGDLHQRIIDLLQDQLKRYNEADYIEIIEKQRKTFPYLVPYWIWQNIATNVLRIIIDEIEKPGGSNEQLFNFDLLKSSFSFCNCLISWEGIEIIPNGIDISMISSYQNATRRIFMSATLSDDSVFITKLGLERNDISTIITPENANDMGDRLILFPRHLNHKITNAAIIEKVNALAEIYNVAVIVPSRRKAEEWTHNEDCIISKDNIEQRVNTLRAGHVGLSVFVNRYDGIDLPDDACRLLVIDGLPPLNNAYEKYIAGVVPNIETGIQEGVRKIEQAMGRGVRSNSDSCCIILMGNDLTNALIHNNGTQYFSIATQKQYELSKQLWDLLISERSEPTIEDIFEIADYSLTKKESWIRTSRATIANLKYNSAPNFNEISIGIDKAFKLAIHHHLDEVESVINSTIQINSDNLVKGYLIQTKAMYLNSIDKSKAQEMQKRAHSLNYMLLPPLDGICYIRKEKRMQQARDILSKCTTYNPNDLIIYVQEQLESLSFGPNVEFDKFEKSLHNIGVLLGFSSSRPDKETNGKGPDNLIQITNNCFMVIECKNQSVSDTISKDYCNQLSGSVNWFNIEYQNNNTYNVIPVMVHQSNVIDVHASPIPSMRVMNKEKLERFTNRVNDFFTALAAGVRSNNDTLVNDLLHQYKLTGNDIIDEYTTNPVRDN